MPISKCVLYCKNRNPGIRINKSIKKNPGDAWEGWPTSNTHSRFYERSEANNPATVQSESNIPNGLICVYCPCKRILFLQIYKLPSKSPVCHRCELQMTTSMRVLMQLFLAVSCPYLQYLDTLIFTLFVPNK